MQKIIIQFLLLVAVFFTTWFVLNQVDWMQLFQVEETGDKLEEKIGDLYVGLFAADEVLERDLINPIDSLLSKICEANDLDRDEIKFHLVENSAVNAMAMPDKNLVVFTGLIEKCNSEAELCGVICHELGHIQKSHIMKKLVQEVGLAVLINMTGEGSGEIIRETFQTLTGTAYSRALEKEADIVAVDYLVKTKIDPEPFANLMYQMGLDHIGDRQYDGWVSTHPASKERAEYILDYGKGKVKNPQVILAKETWEKLQNDLEAL
jgi:predicted Zn-dependent protease